MNHDNPFHSLQFLNLLCASILFKPRTDLFYYKVLSLDQSPLDLLYIDLALFCFSYARTISMPAYQ